MNQRLTFPLAALLLMLAVDSLADSKDSHVIEANRAIKNNNFTQAEIILQEHLSHTTEDAEARFLLARVFSWQNKWTQAIEQFDALLKETPGSADLLLARANTLEWMGLRKQALYDLKKARGLAPEYSAIWRTEIIILQRDNTPTSNSKAFTLISEAKQKFPDRDWDSLHAVTKTVISERDSYATEFIYGYDQLTNNRSPWSMRSIKLSKQTADKHYSHIQIGDSERFDLKDWQIGGSYALPLWQSWSFYVAANYSPTHRVLANKMLDTNLSKSFKNGTVLGTGISKAIYNQTSSQQLHLSAEHYWSDFRLAYTYRLIDVLKAGTGVNHNIQFNYYYSATDMIGASSAIGEDVEFDGTANPPISDVLTFSVYGYHMFKPRWSLIYSLFYHQQGDFYNRNGFVLGIKFDF